jgi:hypothetical protein
MGVSWCLVVPFFALRQQYLPAHEFPAFLYIWPFCLPSDLIFGVHARDFYFLSAAVRCKHSRIRFFTKKRKETRLERKFSMRANMSFIASKREGMFVWLFTRKSGDVVCLCVCKGK